MSHGKVITHASLGVKSGASVGRVEYHKTLCSRNALATITKRMKPRLTFDKDKITCKFCLKSKKLDKWEEDTFAHVLNEVAL